MKKYWELFFTFFKIGLFTFGGGYAMIPLIEHDCVEKKGWITYEDMMNVTVIAESTPGPVAINCSTFVGAKQAGIPGALLCTFGVVLPSFLIIYLISLFLNRFLEIRIIADAFRGIKVAVGILIISAAWNMLKKMKKEILPCIIAACAFLFMLAVNFFAWNVSSIYMMLGAAVLALGAYVITLLRGGKGEDRK